MLEGDRAMQARMRFAPAARSCHAASHARLAAAPLPQGIFPTKKITEAVGGLLPAGRPDHPSNEPPEAARK